MVNCFKFLHRNVCTVCFRCEKVHLVWMSPCSMEKTRQYPRGIQRVSTHYSTFHNTKFVFLGGGGLFCVRSDAKSLSPPREVSILRRGKVFCVSSDPTKIPKSSMRSRGWYSVLVQHIIRYSVWFWQHFSPTGSSFASQMQKRRESRRKAHSIFHQTIS